ncbi:hypothetical protein P7C73_g3496, partial [Tremellales sp. Uapishka_1]
MEMNTVPSPRSSRSSQNHSRRPSLPALASSPRSMPLPIPARQSSIRSPRTHTRGLSSTSSLNFAPPSGSGSISFPPAPASFQLESQLEGRQMSLDAEETGEWLDIKAEAILAAQGAGENKLVLGSMGMEEAVDILLKGEHPCLIVQKSSGPTSFAFFDYADLNAFLLLVLQASSPSPLKAKSPSVSSATRPPHLRTYSNSSSNSWSEHAILEEDEYGDGGVLDERGREIVRRLRKGEKVGVEAICDISQKDPYHSFPSDTPLSTLLPLFASGVHRVAIIPTPSASPAILTSSALIEHLLSLPPTIMPSTFNLPVSSCSLNMPLHPLISLPGTASVLDAMQVMSFNGLSALGVLSGSGSSSSRDRVRRESSGSSNSSSASGPPAILTSSPSLLPSAGLELTLTPSPSDGGYGELVSVVTVKDCARIVVPSEGKQVLGMGLERMGKGMQVIEDGGRERGEERIPVHTISHTTTLIHACHLLLATSSSRIFLRQSSTPPLSPTPSLSLSSSSPPMSPSISLLSLNLTNQQRSGLPAPPPTQLSSHFVISLIDILSALARTYRAKLSHLPVGAYSHEASTASSGWDLDPGAMGKRRRASSSAGSGGPLGGLESWRWAGRVGRG